VATRFCRGHSDITSRPRPDDTHPIVLLRAVKHGGPCDYSRCRLTNESDFSSGSSGQSSVGALPPGTGYRPFPMAMEWLKGDQMPAGVERGVAAQPLRLARPGMVSAVENQGACGSCYSFASLGSLESKMLIDGAGTWNFSQNNVKECNWQEVTTCRIGAVASALMLRRS